MILAGIAFLVYTEQYYHADESAYYALESDETVKVMQTEYGWLFDGPSETDAIIFYPGGKVEETAYASLLHNLAGQGMDPYYYALVFSSLTGCRVGEICSFKWSDVDYENEELHIHTQQLSKMVDGHYVYYEVPYTKNERGISRGGRLFPLTDDLVFLLDDLLKAQEKEGIVSEYLFCHEDGRWLNTKEYDSFFRKLCQKCKLNVNNNHALRMSLNSNVLIPLGISVADRAKLLGHSVATNLQYYSYAQKDYTENARNVLNHMSRAAKDNNLTLLNTCRVNYTEK